MTRPLYFLVWSDGTPHRFDTRKGARIFAALEKLKGHQVTMKAIGV